MEIMIGLGAVYIFWVSCKKDYRAAQRHKEVMNAIAQLRAPERYTHPTQEDVDAILRSRFLAD